MGAALSAQTGMRMLARNDVVKREPTDINQLVGELTELIQLDAKARHQLRKEVLVDRRHDSYSRPAGSPQSPTVQLAVLNHEAVGVFTLPPRRRSNDVRRCRIAVFGVIAAVAQQHFRGRIQPPGEVVGARDHLRPLGLGGLGDRPGRAP